MSQDWEGNWAINDSNFIIYPEEKFAGGNFPARKKLLTHDSIQFEFNIIVPSDANEEAIRNLRFGFIYLDASKSNSQDEYNQWKETYNLSPEINNWMSKQTRSRAEIESWLNEHALKKRNDPRVIWEK